MRAGTILATLLLVLGNAALAAGSVPATSGHGSIYFGDYEPKEPRSLNDLPVAVRELLRSHLKSRLGDLYYRRLKFVGGQVIDRAELLRLEPDSKDYEWEVPAYVIDFDFRIPELGLASYPAQIELRADGSVIKEIDLPAFGSDLGKQAFFPFTKALEVALKRGFDRDGIKATLKFSERFNSLVWDFREVSGDDGLVIKSETLLVSAHTGEVLDTGVSEAIR